jgi:hypothetical protein
MQVFHTDHFHQSTLCQARQAAVSVFFNLTAGADNNNFFDFQKQDEGNQSIDLSRVLNVGASMNSHIMGYIGTDTMPLCTNKLCWYL